MDTTIHTTIRMPKSLKMRLAAAAKKESRSSANLHLLLVQEGLERREKRILKTTLTGENNVLD